MAEILNFNPDRRIGFDPQRRLGFDPGRPLGFEPGRGVMFDPNRDLGFGRRGIVFRGYICPICEALVTEDASRCAECGAVFESRPRAAEPQVPGDAPKAGARPRAKPPATPEPPAASKDAPRPSKFCAFCGATLKAADGFCWNCGARSVGKGDAVRLPAQEAEPVTKQWRGPGAR